MEEKIYTFTRICVEVDLSKGLLNLIRFSDNKKTWTQLLDFENTTFRCRICWQAGHLQNTCPNTKKELQRKKKPGKKRKGWKFPSNEPDEEEDDVEKDPISNMGN